MSLRALGSLLSRRFSPRGIPSARVLAQARDLDVVDGAVGTLAAAGGITALIGILYALEVTGKEIRNVVTDMKRPPVDDPAIRAKFMGEDGKVAWVQYRDYINFLMRHPEVTEHDEMIQKMYPEGPTIKNVRTEEQEGMSVDEPAMQARFEEWMKQFGRTYKNQEEKAMRYEIFKTCAIRCDKANATAKSKASARFAPNNLADWTFEEMYGPRRDVDDSYWEEYFDYVRRMYAEGRIQGYPRTVDADQKVGWTDAAKQWYEKLKTKKTGPDAGRKAEQAGATMKTRGGLKRHPWFSH